VLNDVYRYGYYGVEYIASLGTDTDVAFSVRDEQRQGKLAGAQLFTAGRGITAKGGWPTPILKGIPIEVGTEAEARKAANEMATKKVDLIKIWVDDNMGALPKLSPAISAAIIDEAHKRNLKVVAHVFYLADAKDLVKAGVDGLVHSIRDREVDDDLINAMKSKNVIYTPTLTAHESKFVYVDKPSWLGEQSMREVFPAQLSAYVAADVFVGKMRRDPNLAKFREQYAIAQKNLKKMAAAGVKIGLGTDSGAANTFPGYFEHREIELMEAAGMAPTDIIKAVTSTSAEFLGIKDGGVLAPGKNANFLVLTANPLDKARNSREIFTIYMNGHEIDRAAMLGKITNEVPKITQADIKNEAIAQQEFNQKKIDDALPHFGKFPAADASVRIAGMAIPVPKYSKETHKAGPPHVITVSLDKATGGDLAEFYQKILPQRGWNPAGACFEKKGVIGPKMNSLCLAPAGNQITLNITEK
jgi:imidazolonepropionase-like amidohydrolase